ncbi:MAG TPA: M15 family metallopeptidase [Candidatus Limnocylindrales bacterium]
MPDLVLLSDPVIAEVPLRECGEPLIDLRSVRALRVDPRLADPAGHYALLRRGVTDRLVTAQTVLPAPIGLLIIEGYRPPELQARYFSERVAALRAQYPQAGSQWLRREAGRYVSPPEVAPHAAGAAVDLTLCTTDGHELWMGTEVNDASRPARHTYHPDLDDDATNNRATLIAALTAVGMVNYPIEWWHWSYGDRYWAYINNARVARYGPVLWQGDDRAGS